MAVRQKWPMMRLECHGFTRPATIMGSSRIPEMTARKKAVCTLSTWVESRRIIALVEVKMKPPLTSHSAPCTLGGRRRSQSCIPIALDLAFAAGPVGLAQSLLQHFADGAARQGGDAMRLRADFHQPLPGGGASLPPKARCIRTLSSQRPNLKPIFFKVPTISKPQEACSRIEGVCAESPITATIC